MQETGPTMDISNLRTTLDPTALSSGTAGAAPAGSLPTGSQGAVGGDAPAPSSQTGAPLPEANVSPSQLQKAVQRINQQLDQSSGVTLSAGLDTSGAHPGQVLVELSDKATRQTFFKYYVPASQIVQASQNPGVVGALQGTLISAKA